MNKGFEIRFRGTIARIAVNELSFMSIFVQKIRGKFDLSVIGNLKSEGEPYRCWMFADDLVLGEEVIIERKEIKQSSDPLRFPDSWKAPVSNEKKELQWKLRRFHTLEELLSEEGLV